MKEKKTKKKVYEVLGTLAVPLHCYVRASSEKEALELGLDHLTEKIPEPDDIADSILEEDVEVEERDDQNLACIND